MHSDDPLERSRDGPVYAHGETLRLGQLGVVREQLVAVTPAAQSERSRALGYAQARRHPAPTAGRHRPGGSARVVAVGAMRRFVNVRSGLVVLRWVAHPVLVGLRVVLHGAPSNYTR